MRLTFAAVLTLFVAATATARAQPAPPTPVDSRVVAAELSPEGAQVERRGEVRLRAGGNRLQVGPLPPTVPAESVRVQIEGAGGVRVVGYEVPVVRAHPEADAALVTARARVKELEEAAEVHMLAIAALDRQRETLRSLSIGEQVEASGPAPPPPALDPRAWARTLDFVEHALRENAAQRRGAQAQLDVVTARLDAALEMVRALRETADAPRLAVVADVESPEPGTATLRVRYLLPSASWAPRYALRVTPGAEVATLEAFAFVQQASGEPWRGTTLRAAGAAFGEGDVPGDGTPARFELAAHALPTELVYECVPAESPVVFRVAALRNTAPAALAAGPVSLFLAGDYLGEAWLPAVAPGATATVSLGVEPGLSAARRIETEEREEGWFEKTRHTRVRVHTQLRSVLPEPVIVHLYEPVPSAGHEDIRVEGARGGVQHARVELPARGERELSVGYTVVHRGGVSVAPASLSDERPPAALEPPPAGAPASATTTLPLREAEVHAGSARLTRAGEVQLGAGETRVAIEGFPAGRSFAGASVRVRGAEVRAVGAAERPARGAEMTAVRRLGEQLAAARAELALADDALDLARQRQDYLRSYDGVLRRAMSARALQTAPADVARWQATLAWLTEAHRAAGERLAAAQREQAVALNRLEALRAELAEQHAAGADARPVLVLTLYAEREGPAAVEIATFAEPAGWSAHQGDGAAAAVWQRTGEVWEDVALTLIDGPPLAALERPVPRPIVLVPTWDTQLEPSWRPPEATAPAAQERLVVPVRTRVPPDGRPRVVPVEPAPAGYPTRTTRVSSAPSGPSVSTR